MPAASTSPRQCSGERPACRLCVRRRVQCHYAARQGETPLAALKRNNTELKARATVRDELFDLLQTLPDLDAQGLLQRIRAGNDMAGILRQFKAGDLLLQMAVQPETRFRYEFPYLSTMPADLLPDNPYLNSALYEATTLYPPSSSSSSPSPSSAPPSDEGQDLYFKPFHAAVMVDPKLSKVKPSLWTSVCSDDALMRDLLGVWFRCEYHFTAAFQKDYLLEDMAEQREEFCSSLLVNIVLAYACICYPKFTDRAEYWNPQTLTYRFFAEARRLWELEAAEPRLTTVSAGIIFSVFYNLCGLDEIGQPYRIQSVALARALRLYNGSSLVAIDGESDRVRNGKAFIAWASYNWEALVAFSFAHAPLVKNPPDWRLPDASKNSQWYGETWVQYPLGCAPFPSGFGQVFETRSRFRIVMNEFCEAAYGEGSAGVSLDKAYELRAKLHGWYESLPESLQPQMIALPGHLQLHIYYHHLIMTIYKPLLDTTTEEGKEPTPRQIIADASRYLQTLIRLYYLRHGYDAMDLFIVIPLVLAGSDCLDAMDAGTVPLSGPKLESLRSTLLLVAKGLYSQHKNHYLAEALFRVIRGRMRPQETALLRDTVKPQEMRSDAMRDMAPAVRSHWSVNIVKNQEEVEKRNLTKLVESYAHMNVEEGSERTDFSRPPDQPEDFEPDNITN